MTIREQIAAWPRREDCLFPEDGGYYVGARLATADAVIDGLLRATGDAEVNAIRDALEYQKARAVLDALD